ncbi:MAG: Gfo/Idh/MocA family protein [Planctomycetaceae bacterium]
MSVSSSSERPFDHDQGDLTRRRFLGRTAAGMVAGLSAVPSPAPAAVRKSAADRVRVGVIGVRRRGLELAVALAGQPGAEVAALCDLDSLVRRTALRDVGRVQARVPNVVSDAGRIFEDQSIDAVVIATPDHSHAPLAIAACQAGKDVYLETPATHGRADEAALREAAAGRVIQCGLQQRSGAHFQKAVELVRSGELGRIGLVRAWAVHRRGDVKPVADNGEASTRSRNTETRPTELDYVRWLGTAPTVAFDPFRHHHHWRWFWDYGSGELGNLGVHLLDVARWGMGIELPQRVTAQGLQLRPESSGETPDTLSVQFEYPEVTLTWEHRLWSDYGIEGRSAGVAFHGTDGTLVVDRGGWKVYGRKDGPAMNATSLLEPHLADFLESIRTRRAPAADLETGLMSSALCHLGNEAYRSGREWRCD